MLSRTNRTASTTRRHTFAWRHVPPFFRESYQDIGMRAVASLLSIFYAIERNGTLRMAHNIYYVNHVYKSTGYGAGHCVCMDTPQDVVVRSDRGSGQKSREQEGEMVGYSPANFSPVFNRPCNVS